jgi:hypothetical protein
MLRLLVTSIAAAALVGGVVLANAQQAPLARPPETQVAPGNPGPGVEGRSITREQEPAQIPPEPGDEDTGALDGP